MLLCVWLNRTRLLSREHHQNLLGDSEADGLLLAPLRRLAELLGEVAKADRLQSVRERLAGFVNALSSCIHSASPSSSSSSSSSRHAQHAQHAQHARHAQHAHQQLPGFCDKLHALLALRHDELVAISWPSRWLGAHAHGTLYYQSLLSTPDTAPAVLARAVSAARRALGGSATPQEVRGALKDQPGWAGLAIGSVKGVWALDEDEQLEFVTNQAVTKLTNPTDPASEPVVRRLGLVREALQVEGRRREAVDLEDALSTLDGLLSGSAPRRPEALRAQMRRLKRVATKADGRTLCIGLLSEQVMLKSAMGQPLPAALAQPQRHASCLKSLQRHVSDLLRGASDAQRVEISAVLSAVPCLYMASTSAGAQHGAAAATTGKHVEAAPAAAAKAGKGKMEAGEAATAATDRLLNSAPLVSPPMPPPMPVVPATSAAPHAEWSAAPPGGDRGEGGDGDEAEDEDAEDAAYVSADEGVDEGADEGVSYDALGVLEARYEGQQQHRLDLARLHARRAIETSKARLIQRRWRRWRSAQEGAQSGAVDEIVLMYRERLARFRSTQAMKRTQLCLFCGTEWEAGHARTGNGQHWAQRERYRAYETFVHETAAVLLACLDKERAQLQWEEPARTQPAEDEKAETSRFELLHELERTYHDLNRAMDEVEATHAWGALERVRAAAEFAQLALLRAEGWRSTGQVLVAESMSDDAGAAHVGSNLLGGGTQERAVVAEVDDDEEADEDDELLARMVSAQAKKVWSRAPRQRGGGGGGGKGGGGKARAGAGGSKR